MIHPMLPPFIVIKHFKHITLECNVCDTNWDL